MKDQNKNKLISKTSEIWGGRFKSPSNSIMLDINSSIDVDKNLYKQDIEGSTAHAKMLYEKKIINSNELRLILSGLKKIKKQIQKNEFVFSKDLEDIHMNIESKLTEIIGEPAKKLHTGRSRNDQVATDMRLWIREAIKKLDLNLKELQKVLIKIAEKHTETVMPGFTHLQTAQPITFGFHIMSYVYMIGRDRNRFRDCKVRLNESPLGSGALSGTSFPINRKLTSDLLDFDRPMDNAMDAVSSRDFALEFLSCICICSTHLSRFAEEIVLWSTQQFDFIKLHESMTTGSSMMPQKRNPDAAELVRAKVGSITGNFLSLVVVLKGLPLAYSKDMQEDKLPIFNSFDSIYLSVNAIKEMLRKIKINKKKMRSALNIGHPTATDLADIIVRDLKIPFRKAHSIVGKIVALADKKEISISDLDIKEIIKIEPSLSKLKIDLSILNSIKSKKSLGSTSFSDIKRQIINAKKKYL